MAAKRTERILDRYYEEMWNPWNFALADELIAPEIRFRGSLAVQVKGLEGFKDYMRFVQSAFPDFSNTIEETVCEGSRIAARLTYRGTHGGELFGISATGKRIAYSGAAIFQLARGQITQGWVLGDTAELIRQLNAPSCPSAADGADSRTRIVAATAEQREWAAALMAGSEPWITLRRDFDACRRAFQRPDSLVFIALAGDEPCGFTILQRRGVADSPYIKSVGVAEHFRGRGVGTGLVQFAEDFFRHESQHIFLCVSSFNVRARALYERLGYCFLAELKDFVIPGAAEILLHKRLTSS
jgi:predicted ester cyclase/ribosomal protein S18 acetylase RimI-like enzyme